MLTQEEKKQFSEILETLGETLDITETQYNAAVSSYSAVGEACKTRIITCSI